MTPEQRQQYNELKRQQRELRRQDPGAMDNLVALVGKLGKPILRLPWGSIALILIVVGIASWAGYFAGVHENMAFVQGKGDHLGNVIAYGFAGGFMGFIWAWTLNSVKAIRERAAPAADDSKKSIEEWRASRKPDDPWTHADAIMVLAACVRFGSSYWGIMFMSAVGMMMAK